MASRPTSSTRSWRRHVLVGAAIGWILIVVAGAGSSAGDSLLGVANLHVVWFILLGVALVLSIAFLIYLNPFTNEWVEPEKRPRSIGFWFLAAALLAFVIWQPELLENLESEEMVEEPTGGAETAPAVVDDTTPETVAQVTDILLLLAVVAVFGAAWFILRRRSRGALNVDDEQSQQALEKDLADALGQASHELAVAGDPRTAVLRSYAVLETALANHGLSRSKAETPTEHLRRSLRNLRVDSVPLIRLGQLYELARFSEHPILAAQQDDAAQALDQARASLASLM